eukprot:763500-Hanusia_phi.AAC.2
MVSSGRMNNRQTARPAPGQGDVRTLESLQAFENDAVASTVNAVNGGSMSERCSRVAAEDLHTLIRCTLTHTNSTSDEGCDHEMLGTALVKLPVALPAGDDLMSFKSQISRVLAPSNSMFEGCHEVRAAMLKHVEGLEGELLGWGGDPEGGTAQGEDMGSEADGPMCDNLDEAAKARGVKPREGERLSTRLMPSMLFEDGARFSDRVNGWEMTSRLGPCHVCARTLIRGNGSSQLDWTTPARSARAVAWGLRESGVGISRHCITARRGGEEYVLDALYLPVSAGASEALCASVVKMVGAPCNEAPGLWRRAFHTMPASAVDARTGSNRYDLVCAQTANLVKHARDVTIKHIQNQVMRDLLRRRKGPLSEEQRRLEQPARGRHIKSEATMQQFNNELAAELTPEEMAETNAWVEFALSCRMPLIQCVRGGVSKSYDPAGLELSTVSADLDVKYVFGAPCRTMPFQGQSISLELGNQWRMEAHGLTLVTHSMQ